jgi:hypothetical protein
MKDKTVIIAAVIIAVSIIYLGRSFRQLTGELAAFREENPDLVGRLERLSADLPEIADEAGQQAGQGAVRGVLEEAVERPLVRLKERVKQAAGGEGFALPEGPLVRLEVVKPEVSVEVFADFTAEPMLREIAADLSAEHDADEEPAEPVPPWRQTE